jgi:alanine-glyoxylate transaminase / serine-glyoxylate transaminase / serine-pyruvate transaminase
MPEKDLLGRIEKTLLMGPGPSSVPDEVYAAISLPTLGHLDPLFIRIMDETKAMLAELFGTKNRLTLPISGTGSAGMETCFVNLVEPGDKVLILSNGVFGGRMVDLAGRLGAEVDKLEFEWGTPVRVDAVRERLAKQAYALVAVVHAETSTGVLNPAAEIGALVRDTGALYLLDTVTSLGGLELAVDAWGVDAVYSGTQKCLSCPPGLSPISFSERALEKLRKRTALLPSWYFDLRMIERYWDGQSRTYHHTAPINMIYALHRALSLVLEEGTARVFARHQSEHRELVSGLEQLGLEMFVHESSRLPMLNAVVVPAGVDEAAVRRELLERHRIEIGAGLGPMAGKVWRIGLMGHTARHENVVRFLTAFEQTLSAHR